MARRKRKKTSARKAPARRRIAAPVAKIARRVRRRGGSARAKGFVKDAEPVIYAIAGAIAAGVIAKKLPAGTSPNSENKSCN